MRKRNLPTLMAMLTALTVSSIAAQAEILVFETFDTDGPITDYPRWTGPGQVVDGELIGQDGQGGYVNLGVTNNTGTIYFSLDITITSLGNYHGVSFFDSYSPTREEHAYYGMRGTSSDPAWGMTDGIGGADASTPIPQIGVTYRLVGKLDMDASPSPIGWLWLNPSPSDTDANALVVSPGAESFPSVSRIRLQAGGPGAGSYDNLIIGTTWSDVVNYSGGTIRLSHSPILPPPVVIPGKVLLSRAKPRPLSSPLSTVHSTLPALHSISTKGNIHDNTYTLVGGTPACRLHPPQG